MVLSGRLGGSICTAQCLGVSTSFDTGCAWSARNRPHPSPLAVPLSCRRSTMWRLTWRRTQRLLRRAASTARPPCRCARARLACPITGWHLAWRRLRWGCGSCACAARALGRLLGAASGLAEREALGGRGAAAALEHSTELPAAHTLQFFKDKDRVATLIGVKMKKDYRAVIDQYVGAPAAV